MNAAVVIPARFASTRLPGKPLLLVAGKPVIQYVYENARRARSVSDVLVATDDQRILDAVLSFGGKAVMTSPDCPSGSDRVAEVVRRSLVHADVIVNLQSDEPELRPDQLDTLVQAMDAPDVLMATLAVPLDDPSALADPSQVKVVTDLKGDALYFSRAPIPVYRDAALLPPAVSSSGGVRCAECGAPSVVGGARCAVCGAPSVVGGVRCAESGVRCSPFLRHLGVYAYRPEFLLSLSRLAPTPLERAEKLEQLRVLEHGHRIRVALTDFCPTGIDTPDDLERFRRSVESPTQRR